MIPLAIIALLLWAGYREAHIAGLKRSLRGKLAARDGDVAAVRVAPVCKVNMLSARPCPLAAQAVKTAYVCVDEVRTPRERYKPTSQLVANLRPNEE